MSEAIAGLAPRSLWEQFSAIAAIPRPSKKEERIAAHVISIARKHNMKWQQDATGNILIRKPASAGKESSPSVAVQSHLDMVCEKNKGMAHDFDADGIQLRRSGGYITANGTTLGADNGIGVAAALAVFLDSSLVHGPLEGLFTVDEETGLTGANGLKPGFLKSGVLLNLDSEEDGALYVGCSGGRDTLLKLPAQFAPVPEGTAAVTLAVTGLRGGHSGLDINSGRANAIKLLARALWSLGKSHTVHISHIDGGSKRNAIPREAEALLYVRGDELEGLRTAVAELNKSLRNEYSTVEPGLALALSPPSHPASGRVFEEAMQIRILQLLSALPHGVVAMSPDIPGLVETSTNIATVATSTEMITVGTSQRSSITSALEDLVNRVQIIGGLAGAAAATTDGYPGWKPNLESRVLKVAKETHKELFGVEPHVKAIHAGLECGIIGEKYPGIDMVSFGPTIEGAHSPDERVEIATVERFWKLLVSILRNLS